MPPRRVVRNRKQSPKKRKTQESGSIEHPDEGVSPDLQTRVSGPDIRIVGELQARPGQARPTVHSKEKLDADEHEDEDGDEMDEMDEDEGLAQAKADQKKANKKSRAKYVLLDPEQEQNLIDWLKSHPELYDIHKNEFRKTTLKVELWEAKAKSLDITLAELQQWYATQRTRFGKLLKKPGKHPTALTDREKWIMENFDFLKPHIHTHPSRQTSSVSTTLLSLK